MDKESEIKTVGSSGTSYALAHNFLCSKTWTYQCKQEWNDAAFLRYL